MVQGSARVAMEQGASATVLDHFARPRNLGRLPDANGRGAVGDLPGVDAWIEVALRVDDDIVTTARFRAFGCSATIAASSMATELIVGQPLARAAALTSDELEVALGGLAPARRYAAALTVRAVQAAVADYRQARRALVREP